MKQKVTMTNPEKWIILLDTSIILNVLDVPGRNTDRIDVFTQLEEEIKVGSNLLLPFVTILEVGSHISRLASGNHRRDFAQKFVTQVQAAFDGKAPWTPIQVPDKKDFSIWIQNFPENAQQEISLVDHAIIKEWEALCEQHPMSNVKIWSLDKHLSGYAKLA